MPARRVWKCPSRARANWFRRVVPRIRDSVRRLPPAAASALRYRGRMREGNTDE